MSCQLAKGLLLCAALCGLCPAAQANTTAPAVRHAEPPDPLPAADLLPLEAPSTMADEIWSRLQPVRIALLLPLRSAALGSAAEAVRAGFAAAYQREPEGISVDLIRTGDLPRQALAGYRAAGAHYDIVVGPLSRTAAMAVAQEGAVDKPTVVLNALDSAESGAPPLPPKMLAIGLSLEEEARQAADWAGAEADAGKAYVVFTRASWERRAAQAFTAQWRRLGREAEPVEVGVVGGYLDWKPLLQLRKRVRGDHAAVLFAALDASQARQLREAVGAGIPLYGTSQLNPFVLAERDGARRIDELDGAHLVDLPWQLQADHPAVMIYPRPVTDADKEPNADMARLYALGIDAYRVAREIAGGHQAFELDGVTGKLSVRFGRAGAHFERREQRAVYHDGVAVPVADPAR